MPYCFASAVSLD